jgi:hypothetical protein
MSMPERAIREFLLTERREIVAGVLRCADRVVGKWNDDSTTDRNAVVQPLSREFRETGLLARFPDLLSEAVSAAGFSLPARPVPAPPYVVVTSRGPVLRATLPEGRLVISFLLFDVVRDDADDNCVRYVRGGESLEETVSVELR